MRVLEFIVDGQILTKNPSCDFSNIVSGTEGYLQAHFTFSPEWDGAVKVAAFWRGNLECPPQLLRDGHTCVIPSDALVGRTFGINILGKKGNQIIPTNRVEVRQKGGKP